MPEGTFMPSGELEQPTGVKPTPTPEQFKEPPKSHKRLIILLIILFVLIVLGAGGWFAYNNYSSQIKSLLGIQKSEQKVEQKDENTHETGKYTSTKFKVSFDKNAYFIKENSDGVYVGYQKLYVISEQSITSGIYGPVTIKVYDKEIVNSQVSPTSESKIVGGESATITTSKFASYSAPGATRDRKQIIVSIPSKNIMIIAQDYNAGGNYDWSKVNTMLNSLISSIRFN